jgi:hypothetical protein
MTGNDFSSTFKEIVSEGPSVETGRAGTSSAPTTTGIFTSPMTSGIFHPKHEEKP